MCIFEPGPLIGRMRGKLGGVVATNSRSSPVLRSWRKPIDPAAPLQSTLRANLSIIAAHWRDGLTPANRASWAALALTATFRNSLGNQFTPSGREMFFRTAVFNLDLGLALPVGGPNIPFPLWPVSGITEAVGPVLVLAATGDTTAAQGLALYVKISPPLNATINTYDGPWANRHQRNWFIPFNPLNIIAAADLPTNARYFIQITPRNANGAVGFKQLYHVDVTLA